MFIILVNYTGIWRYVNAIVTVIGSIRLPSVRCLSVVSEEELTQQEARWPGGPGLGSHRPGLGWPVPQARWPVPQASVTVPRARVTVPRARVSAARWCGDISPIIYIAADYLSTKPISHHHYIIVAFLSFSFLYVLSTSTSCKWSAFCNVKCW